MIEAKHTPGPLVILGQQQSTEIGSFYAIGPIGKPCTAYVANRYDAGLYAVAPELLASLEELVSYVAPTLKSEFRLSQGLASALQHARAVIVKVEVR